MNKEIIFSGIGGQGVMIISELLCSIASSNGFTATFTPFYGQEKRGGRTMAEMIISNKMGSNVISDADLLLAMDKKSLADFLHKVKPGGCLIYNSSMIQEKPSRNDIVIKAVEANTIARALGADKSANIVALGAVMAELTDILTLEQVEEELKRRFAGKPQALEVNSKALKEGFIKVKALQIGG